MTTLYVVMGSNGWYDRSEWMVSAYEDEAKANAHVKLVTAALNEFLAMDSAERGAVAARDGDGLYAPVPLDRKRGFFVQDRDQRYWLDSVELLSEVPG